MSHLAAVRGHFCIVSSSVLRCCGDAGLLPGALAVADLLSRPLHRSFAGSAMRRPRFGRQAVALGEISAMEGRRQLERESMAAWAKANSERRLRQAGLQPGPCPELDPTHATPFAARALAESAPLDRSVSGGLVGSGRQPAALALLQPGPPASASYRPARASQPLHSMSEFGTPQSLEAAPRQPPKQESGDYVGGRGQSSDFDSSSGEADGVTGTSPCLIVHVERLEGGAALLGASGSGGMVEDRAHAYFGKFGAVTGVFAPGPAGLLHVTFRGASGPRRAQRAHGQPRAVDGLGTIFRVEVLTQARHRRERDSRQDRTQRPV